MKSTLNTLHRTFLMPLRIRLTAALLCSLLPLAPSAALTLDEYGVAVRANGLVDNDTGLQWLDSALTLGTPAILEPYFADGWRIATESELLYLLTRALPGGDPGGTFANPLLYTDYLTMLDALGVGNGGTQPWLCRPDSVDVNCGQSSGPIFVSFDLIIEADPAIGFPDATTQMSFAAYISEVELYGELFAPPCDGMCTGRSMLVRAVPLPAAVWLMLSGLLFLLPRRSIISTTSGVRPSD